MSKLKKLLIIMISARLLISCSGGNDEITDEIPDESQTETEVQRELSTVSTGVIISNLRKTVFADRAQDITTYHSTSDCDMAVLKNIDSPDEIIKQFTAEDFTEYDADKIGGTDPDLTILSRNGNLALFYWSEADRELRIMCEELNDAQISVMSPNESTGDGEVYVAQIGTDSSNMSDILFNGMCNVIKLGDGSALIIDGGLPNEDCADNIYKTLEKLGIAKDSDGRYKIEAWIFTHSHSDHVGAFEPFAKAYFKNVSVRYFVHNFPASDTPQECGTASRAFNNLWGDYFPDAVRINPHAGLKYYFGNVTVNMLYAPDILYGNEMDQNDTSLIFKIEGGGASFLCYGDSQNIASEAMWNMYDSSVFECDLLQITHHGWTTDLGNGDSDPAGHDWEYLKNVYDASNAEYAFVPMHFRYAKAEVGPYYNYYSWMYEWSRLGYQMSYVVNETDMHGLDELTPDYFNSFLNSVLDGTAEHETLIGFDGINKIVSENGLITYIAGNNMNSMITAFTFADGEARLDINEDLYDWLGE